ncbi:MAG: GNAT family N-acetyltransferase [Firmicutes bacterium]|nr:GNAT family N-acetyltransferase [Bacillota bacterium]
MKIKQCSLEIEDLIHQKIREYNRQFFSDTEDLSLYLSDDDDQWIGGIVASRTHDGIDIEFLFVEESFRGMGYGTFLLQSIEKKAVELHVKRIMLNTYEFQSLDFYLKNGYLVFGQLSPCFKEYSQYFLKKEM